VAKAWFGTALLRDPGNKNLQRLVDLADYTENFRNRPKSVAVKPDSKPASEEEQLKMWWLPASAGQTLESDPHWRERAQHNREMANSLTSANTEQFKDDEKLKEYWLPRYDGETLASDPHWRERARNAIEMERVIDAASSKR
jgi:hypothetical protein